MKLVSIDCRYDSHPSSIGRQDDSKSGVLQNGEKPEPHEYINTANLSPATHTTYEVGQGYPCSQPPPGITMFINQDNKW